MVIVIDNTDGKAYISNTMSAVIANTELTAKEIDILTDPEERNVETIGRYTIHFDIIELKCKSGFARYPKNIYTINHT